MKKLTLVAIALFTSNVLFAQDKIITHNSDTIICKIVDVLENNIKYKFPNEDFTNVINNAQVEKVEFSSGRIQIISEKIVINGENDWEKVLVTNVLDEIKGLKRKGEVYGKSTGAWGAASNAKKVYKKAEEKLKKEAAKMGAHIIYMKDLIVKDGDLSTGQWAKSMLSGVAYGYK